MKKVTIFLVMFLAMALSPLFAELETYDQRVDYYYQSQAGDPYNPRAIIVDWNDRGDFTRYYCQDTVLFAAKSFYLGLDNAEANQALIDMCQYHIDRPVTFFEIHSFPGTAPMLAIFCNRYPPSTPNGLSQEAYEKILETMWLWLDEKSDLDEAETEESKALTVYDSENHHANHFSTCFAFSATLKDVPEYSSRLLSDGRTAGDHYQAWSDFISLYILQRAKKGMLVEISSPSYSTATMGSMVIVHLFAEEALLKARAENYLTLFWSIWAQQQLNGVEGGGKTRCYSDSAKGGGGFARYLSWFLFGFGEMPYAHASRLKLTLGLWRAPQITADIALDQSRGNYEIKQRRLGLANDNPSSSPYKLRGDFGGILRYSYCTDNFILGTLMCDNVPRESWTAISSQNRWQGVIIKHDDDIDMRVFPSANRTDGASSYNQYFSAQSKGTLVTVRQSATGGSNLGDMRVYFSGGNYMTIHEQSGWVFAETDSVYVAVKPAWGSYTWDDSNWIKLTDSTSPVIMEVAQAADYMELFAVFQSAVMAHPLPVVNGNTMTYTGFASGDNFTFYTDISALPKINGQTINLAPEKVYNSPYLSSLWDSGVVTISKDNRSVELNFIGTPECGDWGYYDGDINEDCYVNSNDLAILADQHLGTPGQPSADIAPPGGDGNVNIQDFAQLAADWMKCSDPLGAGCTDPLAPPPILTAANPSPTDGADDVSPQVILLWAAPPDVTDPKYDIYFSTDANLVTTGDVSVLEANDILATSFDPPGDLSYETHYCWRVDVIAPDEAVYSGEVWSFTTGAEGAILPVTHGLVVHLHAQAITGLSDAQPVSTWLDQSAAANHAAQSNPALQPKFYSAVLNGYPVVRFDGSDYMALPTDLFNVQSFTIFLVGNSSVNDNNNQVFWKSIGNDGDWTYRTNLFASWLDADDVLYTVGATDATGGVLDSTYHYHTLQADGDNKDAWMDGAATASWTDSQDGTPNTRCGIGSDNGVNKFLIGDIAEVIIYNQPLSSIERGQVESYLQNKYSLGP